eukprot:COSAG06_NODE_4149_length_4524_cov_2800.806328_1_plen_116_part_00
MASGDGQIFGAYGLSARNHIELLLRGCKTMDTLDAHKAAHAAKLRAYHAEDAVSSPDSEDSQGSPRGPPTYTCPILNSEEKKERDAAKLYLEMGKLRIRNRKVKNRKVTSAVAGG